MVPSKFNHAIDYRTHLHLHPPEEILFEIINAVPPYTKRIENAEPPKPLIFKIQNSLHIQNLQKINGKASRL